MRGIAEHTEAIIERVSRLECIEGWTLVGGTALAIQLDHRKSEDLDFMRWQTHKGEHMEVDWPKIRKQLETVGDVRSMDILDRNHVEFVVAGVKLSFYARESKSPVKAPIPFLNHIVLADVDAIASLIGMKDINIPMVFSGISYYAICLPSAYLLGFVFDLGPVGVWCGLLFGLAAAAVLFYTRFVKICKREIKTAS